MWISSFFQSVTACSCWLQADLQIWVATSHPSFEMSLRPFSFTKQVLVRLDLLKYWRELQLARTISSVARKWCSSQVTLACLHRATNSSELRFRFSLRHHFSNRSSVLPFIFDCYEQHWGDPHGSVSCAPTSPELRHYGVFDGTHWSEDVCCGGFSGDGGHDVWLGVVGLKRTWD